MNIAQLLVIANFVILVGGAIGGYIVIRSTMANAERIVEDRVRQALVTENVLLTSRVARLEKDNQRLDRLMAMMIDVLKKTRNIDLEVNDDMVIIRDDGKMQIRRITPPEQP